MDLKITSKEELKEKVEEWQSLLTCPCCGESLLKREAYTSLGAASFTGGFAFTIAVGILPAAGGVSALVSGTLTYFGVWGLWEKLVERVDPLSPDQLHLERVDEDTVICTHCQEPLTEEQTALSTFE
jgi:hypothetical protein